MVGSESISCAHCETGFSASSSERLRVIRKSDSGSISQKNADASLKTKAAAISALIPYFKPESLNIPNIAAAVHKNIAAPRMTDPVSAAAL